MTVPSEHDIQELRRRVDNAGTGEKVHLLKNRMSSVELSFSIYTKDPNGNDGVLEILNKSIALVRAELTLIERVKAQFGPDPFQS